MQDSNARTLRGVSIAVIILAVLAIVIFLLGTVAVAMFGAIASDPSWYGNGISLDDYDHGYYDSLSPEATAGIVAASLGIAVAALVWCILCSVVTLIAGVLGVRNHDKPEKQGGVFGWSIAGAIAAFLSGRIITVILLVIAAVYSNKLRNAANNPYGQPPYAQPGYGQPMQPQPYGQQAPQQPGYYQQAPIVPQQQAPAPTDAAGQQPAASAPEQR